MSLTTKGMTLQQLLDSKNGKVPVDKKKELSTEPNYSSTLGQPTHSDPIIQAQERIETWISHEPIPSADQSQHEYDDEPEMPGLSMSIGPDEEDADIMQLLSGVGSNQDNSAHRNSVKDPNVIEFYSTIAFLRKENGELMKEVEFIRRSKDALHKEATNKYEASIQKLKLELLEVNNRLFAAISDCEKCKQDNEGLRQDFSQVVQEKDELLVQLQQQEQKDSTVLSLRNENSSLKQEHAKLKLEVSKLKTENDLTQRDLTSLQTSYQSLQQEMQSLTLKHSYDLADRQTSLTRLTADMQAMETSLKQHQQQNQELRASQLALLGGFDREKQDLSYRLTSLGQEHSRQTVQLTTAQQQIAQLQQQVASQNQQQHQMQYQQQQAQQQQSYINNNYHTTAYPPPTASSYQMPISLPPPSPPPAAAPSHSHQQQQQQQSQYSHRFLPPPIPPPVLSSFSAAPPPPPSSSHRSLASTMDEASNLRVSSHSAPPTPSSSHNNNNNNNSTSLGSLLQNRRQGQQQPGQAGQQSQGQQQKTTTMPFATEKTSQAMQAQYDVLEASLTRYMTEKTSLQEESERLQIKGLKTLRDRSRLQQVEQRLGEVGKEISGLRSQLSSKPA